MTHCIVLRHCTSAIICAGLLLQVATLPAADESGGVAFFEKKIRPVLVSKCYECHSAKAAANKKLKGVLLLDTRAGIRRGGESGPAVVPGKPEQSLLLAALRHDKFEMPPEGQLPEDIISDFKQWIEAGAADPRDGEANIASETIDFEKARQFWSFRPPARHNPPQVKDRSWPRDDLDRFVLHAQETQKLTPVGDATPSVLIRRLYYDLTGLPPSPAAVTQFEKACAQDPQQAVTELVDKLLESQHFGERWGRHWLDVARYAESNGAPDKNGTWPLAYRYRDYVIHAFNNDKPYNRFILEQVAGDLLAAGDEQAHADWIVATGLLSLGMKTANQRMDEIDEQLDTVGKSILGLAIGCARCHDHKFDPIPTRDYYALAGIMMNSLPQDGNGTFTRARAIGNVDKANANECKNHLKQVNDREREARKLHLEIKEFLRSSAVDYDVALSLEENVARLEPGYRKKADKRLKKLRKLEPEIKQYAKNLKSIEIYASGMKETGSKGKMVNVRLHIRGSADNLGDEVPRGLLNVFPETTAFEIPADASGRLQLARWLSSSKNPLTARVMVNRIWRHLMGRGIVQTSNNFGVTGQRPTHPELLDTLAVDFMEDGWSIKKMIRRIVLSRTYQLSDTYNAANALTDPGNVNLWRRNAVKLNAEAVRDYILAAAGRLNRKPMAGSLIKSFGAFRGSFNIDLETNRSVYMPALRGGVPPLLAAFNFPPPSLVVGDRLSTTVPVQALVMMNSDWVLEQSDYTALRVIEAADSEANRADIAYQVIFQRRASVEEQQRVVRFAEQLRDNLSQNGASPAAGNSRKVWSLVCQSLFSSAEFLWVR